MITMTTFSHRRKQLMKEIGKHSVFILSAAKECIRNNDAHYPYRQHSDFYYLSGFEEPEAVLLLLPKRKEGEYVLFNRVRDPVSEVWDGARAGQTGAIQDYCADEAFPIHELRERLPVLLSGRDTIYHTLGNNAAFDELLLGVINEVRAKGRGGVRAPHTFHDVSATLHEMRLYKSREEIALMQQAVDITGSGHVAAMRACQPGRHEYELEAAFLYECHKRGARFSAYTPIVGAGKNTCVLHYVANNARIKDGDLVLIDAGAEWQHYASDVTRTFPANGTFSKEQRAIYNLVLKAQLAAIKVIKPGVAFNKPQEVIVRIITQGLIDLGILKGQCDRLIEERAYASFYMHQFGHWLGLDVHDVGRYHLEGGWRQLEPGMTLTVEPGIYIASDNKGVHKRWHHIGVRIEDDVLVTARGCDVLSQAIPKTVNDIERIMREDKACNMM